MILPMFVAALGGGLFLIALIPGFIRGWRYTFCDREPVPLSEESPCIRDGLRLACWMLFGSLVVYTCAYIAGGGDLYGALVKSDALHYVELAKNGYQSAGETRYFLVFFPLFPLCMRYLTFLTGDYLLSAVLLNHGFLYFALWYFYRMGVRCYGRRKAYLAARYLCLFPFALFFRNPYTEALFLMLSMMSICYAMEGRLTLAGLLGLLCALCRSTGVILMLPVFMEGVRRFRLGEEPLYRVILATVLPLAGFGIYLWLNYRVSGNPLQFLIYQKDHWYNGFTPFPYSLYVTSSHLITETESAFLPFWAAQFASILLFSALLALGRNRLHPTHGAYSLAGFFVMLSQTWLLSGGRYLMGLGLPFYLLAMGSEKPLASGIVTALSVAGLGIISYLFCMGVPIY